MSKRIGYIDAMRGFTMILVVYSHVCGFCLGDRNIAFNDVLFLFRLPCFFFISGWLFQGTWGKGTVHRVSSAADYTGTVHHTYSSVWSIVKKKFMVQIVPTVIFLLLLAPPPLFFTQLGATKGGYWFTFALFMFFVLHIFLTMITDRLSAKKQEVVMFGTALVISIFSFLYEINYHRFIDTSYNYSFSFSAFSFSLSDILGFFSFRVWRFYLFFFLGTLARKYFPPFLKLANNGKLMAVITICFLAISQIPQSDIFLREYFKFSIAGILGMTMIFALFRYLSTVFASQGHTLKERTPHSPIENYQLSIINYQFNNFSPFLHLPSSILKFVGTRTLDIYLLHYFFLPEFLRPHATQLLSTIPSPLLPVVILLSALIVVVLCLATSYLLRLSPFLSRYLFGAK